MIKKSVFIMFSLVAMLFICSCSRPAYTKEKWVYSDVLSINVNEDVDESLLEAYLENKGVIVLNTIEELNALETGTVIIRSHGVGLKTYENIKKLKREEMETHEEIS